MRFHAQKLMAKAQVASARLRTLPVGLVNSTIDLLSSLFPVASADRRPAPIDLTCPARPDAVAAAINDVGPEQIMERCGERMYQPRERPDNEERYPHKCVQLEREWSCRHRSDVRLQDEQRPE